MKKKILCLCLSLCITGAIMPMTYAQNTTEESPISSERTVYTNGDLRYEITQNDEITITDCRIMASGAITIPSQIDGIQVTSIDDKAFADCKDITSIKIPSSIVSIGEMVFRNCSNLTEIDVDVENKYYSSSDGVLFNKNILVAYPNGKTDSEYTIPTGTTSIANVAFNQSNKLTNVLIPSSVKSIGKDAFLTCADLTAIDVAADNKYYLSTDGVLFNNNGSTLISYPTGKADTEYTIPGGVTSIDENAFYLNKKITSIEIPDSVTSIGIRAFYNCINLTSINIPNGVTSIPQSTFNDCKNLTNIIIPDSVTSIGAAAFYSCSSLTSVNIPSSVTSIDDNSLINCHSLTSITVDAENQYFSSIDGVLFNKDETSLLCYPKGITTVEYIIPDGVTSIANKAFVYCTNPTNIKMPNTVTSIGDFAFGRCSNLINIELSNSLISIGVSAFAGTNLTNIVIPDSLISIGENAFADCQSLKNIKVPIGVNSIGNSAFNSCPSLTDVYYEGSRVQWDNICDNVYFDNATIHYNYKQQISENEILGCTNNDDKTVVNIKAKNSLDNDVNCYVVAAVYKNGILQKIGTHKALVTAESDEVVEIELDYTVGTGDVVKSFIWDDIDSMIPICEVDEHIIDLNTVF